MGFVFDWFGHTLKNKNGKRREKGIIELLFNIK
jgi:hypothetical protein